MIYKYLKSHDRIFFVDFGISVDDNSLDRVFNLLLQNKAMQP